MVFFQLYDLTITNFLERRGRLSEAQNGGTMRPIRRTHKRILFSFFLPLSYETPAYLGFLINHEYLLRLSCTQA